MMIHIPNWLVYVSPVIIVYVISLVVCLMTFTGDHIIDSMATLLLPIAVTVVLCSPFYIGIFMAGKL